MKFKAFMVSGVLSLAALPAFANGSWSGVTISEVIAATAAYEGNTNGGVLIKFSANGGGPTCGNGNPAWAVVDVSTAAGAYIAAVAQSARLSGSTVSANGLGSCGVVTGYETLGEIFE